MLALIFYGAIMYNDNDYLMHYGILGMKWGVRRYQNKDGTRTALGRKRDRIGTDYSSLTFEGSRAYAKTDKAAPKVKGTANARGIKRLNSSIKSVEEMYDDYKKSLNNEQKDSYTKRLDGQLRDSNLKKYGKDSQSGIDWNEQNSSSEKVKERIEESSTKTKSKGSSKIKKLINDGLLNREVKRGPSQSNSKEKDTKDPDKFTDISQNISKVSDKEAKAIVSRIETENRYKAAIKSRNQAAKEASKTAFDRMDRNTAINLSNDSQNLVRSIKNLKSINSQRKEAKQLKKDLKDASLKVSEMSNEELRAATERKRLENSYYDTVANGRQATADVMDKIGGIVAVAGGVITIAATINSLKR